MTAGDRSRTDAWVERFEMEGAYAFDDRNLLASYFRVGPIPRAILLDPDGTVVFDGDPKKLTDEDLEAAVVGALPTPLYEWPADAARVKKELLADDLAGALAEAEDVGPAYVEMVQGRIRALRDGVLSALEEGDYRTAQRRGERAHKLLARLPEREEVQAVLERLKSDEGAREVLALQEKVAELLAKGRASRSRKTVKGAVAELRELAGEHPGTIVQREAKSAIEELRRRLGH